MGRPIKLTVIAAAVVLLVIVAAVHLWLGTMIKTAVEQVGPKVTGSSVTVKDIDISLLAGRVEMNGVVVGNPPGFQAPTALKVGTARARIEWRSTLSDPIVITELTIHSPEVTYEGVLSKSNFTVILENARAFGGTEPRKRAEASARQPAASAQAPPNREKRFVIKELNVTAGRVTLWVGSNALGTESLSVALPDIHLTDIGKESRGAPASEAAAAVIAALNRSSAQAVVSAARPLGQAAKTAEELLGQGASKAVEEIQGFFK